MKTDIFIKHHQYGLRILEAWPAAGGLPGFYCWLGCTVFFLVFQIWNVIQVYGDLELLMDNLISTIGMIFASFKAATLRIKRRELETVICKIFEDWKHDGKRVMNAKMVENCTRSKIISKIIVFFYNAMNFTYFLRTIVSYAFDDVEKRKFLVQSTFPFDARQSPYYEVIVVSQFVTVTLCFNSQVLVEGLLATLILHTCAKADIVREELTRFSKICQSNYNDKQNSFVTVRRLMKKHMNFIEFSDYVQDIYSFIALFHTGFMTLMQVVAGYMFIDGIERGMKLINFIHYVLITSSLIMSVCLYCAIGEYLTNQCEIIFRELCNCSWYNFPTLHKKTVYFMLVKAEKPVKISVGKFTNLSLIYFTSIMKTSFSYLTLVRSVR